ncbi:MAG: anti-anti-sigma factor [Pelodictyon luteolum]|uniref:Anti-anti-sigma factor, putative n=2 Tax=Pelodictyon luteolum TaxID=1100 RepID=Q3B3N6_CHLL3|nr:STAS domain-containing protein [Pelodictyon luteolum]ABB24045.1 anti-anti-sigma factor, putative [Pelodictyon luteolum DSM 273]KZK75264.1 MAG: anti-anti-sigma factor [Pelodictyon luteolum]
MKHSVSNRKELTILKIEETVFDFRHGTSYKKAVEDLIESGSTNLIIDFSHVKAIDSCGISSILLTHQLANHAHGLAIFVALCQQIKDLLKLTNLDKQLYIFSSINEVVTLVEPAMKTRRCSRAKSKSAAYDHPDEVGDELDLLHENDIDSVIDEDDMGVSSFDDDEEELTGDDRVEGEGSKKRGRPKKTAGPTIGRNGKKSTRA